MKILCWVLVQNLCLVEGDQEPKGSTQTSLATLQALVAVPFATISGQQSKKNVLVGAQEEDVVLGRSVLPKQTVSEDASVPSPLHCADVPALLQTLWASFAPE